jgi:putative ABC transport system ATP-binding protein
MLALDAVVKHYRAGSELVRAVDGVSLELEGGEMIALQGPSGSGKTTLLLLIAGLLTPDEGRISYQGRDVAGFSDEQRSEYLLREIGFVYQSFHLMPQVSAIENAAMKLVLGGMSMRAARRKALPWLERVGLDERVSTNIEQMSGGERQRVAIARALAGEPRLVLADEPTGNLDSARSAQVAALLGDIAREQGTGVLLVTHDRDAAAAAGRRYRLRDGLLTADLTSAEIDDPVDHLVDRTR